MEEWELNVIDKENGRLIPPSAVLFVNTRTDSHELHGKKYLSIEASSKCDNHDLGTSRGGNANGV